MKKHFVTFCSPGSFVSEETTKEIESWDIDQAKNMAANIKERHGAAPYGFYFTTRKRSREDLDSKQADRSSMYYLGGDILTLEDVIKRKDPSDNILISNMRCNNLDRIIINTNSWKHTAPFNDGDVVLEMIKDKQ